MTRLLAALLALMPFPALACGTYTLDSRPPCEVLATIEDDRVLTIDEGQNGKTVYDLASAGTGIDYQEARPRGAGETIRVLEHKGDLIVDMMVYVPFCGEGR